MIDIGVNLLHPQYDADREAVVQRAVQAGVCKLILTGIDLAESRAASDYCFRQPGLLFCTAGIHPHAAATVATQPESLWLQDLSNFTELPQVVALGEMGLDYFRNFSDPAAQRRVFAAQLELAVHTRVPVFAHDRAAAKDMQALIQASGIEPSRMVIHCFTGSQQDLQWYLAQGCMIGITGWVCDRKRGAQLRELVPQIPLDRLLIETDGPYLRPHNAPAQALGTLHPQPATHRNEPALLRYVVTVIATLMGCSEEQLVQATTQNAQRLFPKLELHPATKPTPQVHSATAP